MKATTSPLQAWNSLVRKLPLVPTLAFLLISLPLTSIAIYLLPYNDLALAKFVWLVLLVLVVLLFQVRASMEHPTDRYLNTLTSMPINLVALPAFLTGYAAFSDYPPSAQVALVVFLGTAFVLYTLYALVRGRKDGELYRLLTRRGSGLVQFMVVSALGMGAIWILANI